MQPAPNMKPEMIIVYTEHAKARMALRGISKPEIEQAISQPYFALPSRSGREIIVKRQGVRYLKVICEKSNDKITVITVYWTRRP
jgi:hypothetical protein